MIVHSVPLGHDLAKCGLLCPLSEKAVNALSHNLVEKLLTEVSLMEDNAMPINSLVAFPM